MRLLKTLCAGLALLAASAQEAEQDCEMCGLLVHHLEMLMAAKTAELEGVKEGVEADNAKKGVGAARRRANRATVPAEIYDSFEEFLEKHACGSNDNANQQNLMGGGGGGAVTRNQLCGSNGDDGSKLRNPYGPGSYDSKICRQTLKERCEHVAPTYAEEIMEAVFNNLTAAECAEFLPSCTPTRAKLLLGPYYKGVPPSTPGGRGHNIPMHTNVGVKDVWKKSECRSHELERWQSPPKPMGHPKTC